MRHQALEHSSQCASKQELVPVFKKDDLSIYENDCLAIISLLEDDSVDMIFADPPYMLSNGGVTCHAGQMFNVDKGRWDQSKGFTHDLAFHEAWIANCKRVLKPEGNLDQRYDAQHLSMRCCAPATRLSSPK